MKLGVIAIQRVHQFIMLSCCVTVQEGTGGKCIVGFVQVRWINASSFTHGPEAYNYYCTGIMLIMMWNIVCGAFISAHLLLNGFNSPTL